MKINTKLTEELMFYTALTLVVFCGFLLVKNGIFDRSVEREVSHQQEIHHLELHQHLLINGVGLKACTYCAEEKYND